MKISLNVLYIPFSQVIFCQATFKNDYLRQIIKSLNSFLFKGHDPITFVLIFNSINKAVF